MCQNGGHELLSQRSLGFSQEEWRGGEGRGKTIICNNVMMVSRLKRTEKKNLHLMWILLPNKLKGFGPDLRNQVSCFSSTKTRLGMRKVPKGTLWRHYQEQRSFIWLLRRTHTYCRKSAELKFKNYNALRRWATTKKLCISQHLFHLVGKTRKKCQKKMFRLIFIAVLQENSSAINHKLSGIPTSLWPVGLV